MSDEKTPDPTPDLVHECDLDDPPEKVWRALTEPELVERWLTGGEPGLDCELVEQDPGREARFTLDDNGDVSDVRFRIAAAEDGGTHLVIEQTRVAATCQVIPFPKRAIEPVSGGGGQTVMRLAA